MILLILTVNKKYIFGKKKRNPIIFNLLGFGAMF